MMIPVPVSQMESLPGGPSGLEGPHGRGLHGHRHGSRPDSSGLGRHRGRPHGRMHRHGDGQPWESGPLCSGSPQHGRRGPPGMHHRGSRREHGPHGMHRSLSPPHHPFLHFNREDRHPERDDHLEMGLGGPPHHGPPGLHRHRHRQHGFHTSHLGDPQQHGPPGLHHLHGFHMPPHFEGQYHHGPHHHNHGRFSGHHTRTFHGPPPEIVRELGNLSLQSQPRLQNGFH